MVRAALVVLAGVAACYQPHAAGGTCTTSAECPLALECIDGICGGAPDASVDLTCTCTSQSTLHCASGDQVCGLGCVSGTPGHCASLVPSNAVPATLVGHVSAAISISDVATFDTDTGAITGALVRAAGEGLAANIYFSKTTGMGMFVFEALTITNTGVVKFKGARAAVFLVGRDALVHGTIDGSASGGGAIISGGSRATPGPGGGSGAVYGATAGGCGPGASGETAGLANNSDSGGGGGGGGAIGGAGGAAGSLFLGGKGGGSCLATDLQPLVGGSGGGGGGLGLTTGSSGGGGGGAIQLTALGTITVDGTIHMGGAGGEGGPASSGGNAAAGSGGGAGGGILLEAVTITLGATTVLVANGGGGGGGANASNAGQDGQNAQLSSSVAVGGLSGNAPATAGGDGGAGSTAAQSSADSGGNDNGGGGGGAVGRIFFRTQSGSVSATGTASPAAGNGKIVAQ